MSGMRGNEMGPWDLVGWVAAVAVCVVLLSLTAAVVVATVRGIRNPAPRERKVRIGAPGQVSPGQRVPPRGGSAGSFNGTGY